MGHGALLPTRHERASFATMTDPRRKLNPFDSLSTDC
jgi:hypothetical protein